MSDNENTDNESENGANINSDDFDMSEHLMQFPPEMREEMRVQIENYRKAYSEEFAQSVAENSKQATEKSLNIFKEAAEDSATLIVWLSKNARSESTRLNSLKYILDSLRRGYVDSPSDPVNEILAGIMNGKNVND